MNKNIKKEKLLNMIDNLSAELKRDKYKPYVRNEYRDVFLYGQLDALLIVRERIENDEI